MFRVLKVINQRPTVFYSQRSHLPRKHPTVSLLFGRLGEGRGSQNFRILSLRAQDKATTKTKGTKEQNQEVKDTFQGLKFRLDRCPLMGPPRGPRPPPPPPGPWTGIYVFGIHLHVLTCVCVYVCQHACPSVCPCVRMYVCMYVRIYARMSVFVARMQVFLYVCMYVCMHACMHVCMHVCMHACMLD